MGASTARREMTDELVTIFANDYYRSWRKLLAQFNRRGNRCIGDLRAGLQEAESISAKQNASASECNTERNVIKAAPIEFVHCLEQNRVMMRHCRRSLPTQQSTKPKPDADEDKRIIGGGCTASAGFRLDDQVNEGEQGRWGPGG